MTPTAKSADWGRRFREEGLAGVRRPDPGLLAGNASFYCLRRAAS